MTSLLIFIKHRFPWIWRAVEAVNSRLFAWRYPRFGSVVAAATAEFVTADFAFSPVTAEETEELSSFLSSQPAERTVWFNPHRFDAGTLRRLQSDPAFAMMKMTRRADGTLAGYLFLRCFFTGKAFHGLIADASCSGRGAGRAMWSLSARICSRAGLRMLATVSERNAASLTSACQGTDVTIAERLSGGYLLIECKPRD